MGFYTTFRVMGISSGTLLGGAALNYFGFGTCFYLATAFILPGVLMAHIWVRDIEDPIKVVDKISFRASLSWHPQHICFQWWTIPCNLVPG